MTTINGMPLDPAAQRRLERIRQHNEQNGGNQVDFRTHVSNIRKQHSEAMAEVRDDPRISTKEKYEMLTAMGREMQKALNEGRRDAYAAFDQELERRERAINPVVELGNRSVEEMMRRREVKERLQGRWQRGGDAVVISDLKEALSRGANVTVEIAEEIGRDFIQDQTRRREFGDLLEQHQRANLGPEYAAYEELKNEEYTFKAGIDHLVSNANMDVEKDRAARPFPTREEAEARRIQRGWE